MDLISRQAAVAYSISGMTREIDGEKWIRVSEVRESIKMMPSAQNNGDIDEAVEYIKNAQEYLRDIGETWCANYLSDVIELLVGERGEDGFQKTL